MAAYGDSPKDKKRAKKLEKLMQQCEEKVVNSFSNTSFKYADEVESLYIRQIFSFFIHNF